MCKVFGYARISRKEQNIERQERNIKASYPDAIIVREAFTGTKVEGRKEFEKLLKIVKPGDCIVFDSVSRMSRNAEDGTKLYFELYDRGITLKFLKESHIDTDAYKQALEAAGIKIDTDNTAEGEFVADLVKAVNRFMRAKAAEDIRKAFEQAQKEVDDLHVRTREGIETARRNGKQIGQKQGAKLHTKKERMVKEIIRANSRAFDGVNPDSVVIAIIDKALEKVKAEESGKVMKISRATYFKYKNEMREELNNEGTEV